MTGRISNLPPSSDWQNQKRSLFAGVEIRWKCDQALLGNDDSVPPEAVLHYPGGLADYLNDATADRALMISTPFAEFAELDGQKFEWAITWLVIGEDGFFNSYCNTVPTPLVAPMRRVSAGDRAWFPILW